MAMRSGRGVFCHSRNAWCCESHTARCLWRPPPPDRADTSRFSGQDIPPLRRHDRSDCYRTPFVAKVIFNKLTKNGSYDIVMDMRPGYPHEIICAGATTSENSER